MSGPGLVISVWVGAAILGTLTVLVAPLVHWRHSWRWGKVAVNRAGDACQIATCTRCGKAKLRWL